MTRRLARRGAHAATLTGCATPAGTARYAARFAESLAADSYRAFGGPPARDAAPAANGSLRVASIGIGTYLGDCTDAEDARYAATVRAALARGVNVVDTAINYRCQRSERAVGVALRKATAHGLVSRDEVVVCTKGGYVPLEDVPPPTRAAYRAYLERQFFRAGVMRPEDVVAGGHCLAPSYLEHQIAASRANLGVETIDLYYVHNPEQQLDALPRERLREVLREAFAVLEGHVARGAIVCYGCATWQGLRVPPAARNHLSLVELVEIAREVAGDTHHFRAVQLPVNLAMAEAVRLPTQPLGGRLVPLLHAASELGVAVVASAPLMQGQLAHGLPEQLREAFPGLATDAQRALAFVRSLPVVRTALVGMRHPEHVEENLAVVRANGRGSS